jgi:hypothetical protein
MPDTRVVVRVVVVTLTAGVDECLRHGVLAPEFYSDPAFIRERMMPALASSKVMGECARDGARAARTQLQYRSMNAKARNPPRSRRSLDDGQQEPETARGLHLLKRNGLCHPHS